MKHQAPDIHIDCALIALDMDGTLLNSKKELDELAVIEMKKAAKAGKIIVISTGRCIDEVTLYDSMMEYVHYGILESGAMLYDFKNRTIIYRKPIPSYFVEEIMKVLSGRNIMYQPMKDGHIYLSHTEFEHLNDYDMERFRTSYAQVATMVESTERFVLENTKMLTKFNLYHTSMEEKHLTYEKIKHLPLDIVAGEPTSYEVSAPNINKGNGLIRLCEHLGLDLSRTAAVGDNDNDASILRICGYPIAMGNAKDSIKQICKYIVADNDHHGCAEAIRTFL